MVVYLEALVLEAVTQWCHFWVLPEKEAWTVAVSLLLLPFCLMWTLSLQRSALWSCCRNMRWHLCDLAALFLLLSGASFRVKCPCLTHPIHTTIERGACRGGSCTLYKDYQSVSVAYSVILHRSHGQGCQERVEKKKLLKSWKGFWGKTRC